MSASTEPNHDSVPLLSSSTPDKNVGCFHPTSTAYRYAMLVVISLICFGSYFTYDEIEPITDSMNPALGIGNDKFLWLYSIYSFPNTVLPMFGGVLGDKIGVRLAGMIFVTFVFIGSVITALGGTFAETLPANYGYGIVFIGRLIFGIGAESLNVIQSSMTSIWFKGKELAFAMGLVLSMSRLGDYLALSIGAQIADWFGSFKATLWTGAILCGLSFLCTILYSIMDKPAEKYFNRVVDPKENELNFKAVKHFDVRFWIISFLCLAYYSGVFPFIALANAFLQDEYDYSATDAGYIAGSIVLAAMFLSPVLGRLIDYTGHRPYYIILGSAIILPSHLVLAMFRSFTPILPVICIGLSFSVVPSALWPCIPMITKEEETATAFGLMTAIQNAGLTLTSFVAGLVQNYGYNYALYYFALMDTVGLLLGFLLLIADRYRGYQLSRTLREMQLQSIVEAEPDYTDDSFQSIN